MIFGWIWWGQGVEVCGKLMCAKWRIEVRIEWGD